MLIISAKTKININLTFNLHQRLRTIVYIDIKKNILLYTALKVIHYVKPDTKTYHNGNKTETIYRY